MSPEGKVKHRKFLSGNSESMARKDVGLQGDDKTSEVRDNRINRGAGMVTHTHGVRELCNVGDIKDARR